jgi:purine nucleoside phosphorylase
MQAEAQVGIIGGSGLYDLEGMAGIGDVDIRTPVWLSVRTLCAG